MRLLRNIFFILIILFWGKLVSAQSLANQGGGVWHSLPFADVRLLSCTTGTLNRNLLVGGLQIKIYSGWTLKKPQLRPLSERAVLDYPIRPDPVDTTTYTDTIFIPVVYNIQGEKDFHFGVQGNLVGCLGDNCLDFPIRVELPLDPNESEYTPYCGYVMDKMGQVPKPDLNMGKGRYIDDHTAILQFHVPRMSQAFLQNQNGLHFKILSTVFRADNVQFEVSYPEIWKNKTIQDWILITDQGVFRAPILLDNQPLPIRPVSFPWGRFLLSTCLLFICSPFFILWGTVFPKTNKKLRQQCLWAIVVSALLMIGVCGIMKCTPLPYKWIEIMMPYILGIMGITLIFPPRFVWWAGLLFIIWPKPYLAQLVQMIPLYYLIPWLLVGQILPFVILYRHAEFWAKKARWSLKNDFFYHNLFFLLPTIVMLIYGIYGAQLKIPFQNIQPIDAQQATVVCQKTDCAAWVDEGFEGRFIDAQSSLGKTLLDLYLAQENLIIFDDLQNQTILTDTNPEKFKKYLMGLKNYRAGYRPVHPPVHFGDDLHALSPNAK